MNRCTPLDEILHDYVPWQPLEEYWISRSYIKGQGHPRKWNRAYQTVFAERGKIVVDNAVFHLSIAWSVPEISAIKIYSCPKSGALLITHELLDFAWWHFARTCISITSRILLNFMAWWCSCIYCWLSFLHCSWLTIFSDFRQVVRPFCVCYVYQKTATTRSSSAGSASSRWSALLARTSMTATRHSRLVSVIRRSSTCHCWLAPSGSREL